MQFTLKDMLSLEVLQDLEVLAGETNLNKVVTNVTVLDAPDAIQWIRGNEFVVTTLYPFMKTSDQLRLVDELSRRNASALGIKLKRYVDSLSQEVIELANKKLLPLLQIPMSKAWIDLINPIMAEILNKQLVILRKSNSIRHSFINEILEDGKLQSIAKVLSEITHNPVTIFELTNQQVETWPYYFKNHIKKEDLFKLQNSQKNGHVSAVSSNINSSIEGEVFQIKVAGKVEGYIIVWKTKELKELDYVAVEHAITVAALHVQQLKAVNEVNQRYKDDFLNRLLHGEFSYSYVQQKAGELGWEISVKNSVAVIRTVQLQTDWKKGHNIFNYFKNMIKTECGMEIPMGMDGSDKIICLIPWDAEDKTSQTIINAILTVKSKILKHDKEIAIPIGIGNPQVLIDNLLQSYQEACTACRVSLSIDKDCCRYSELGPYSLLVKLVDTKESEQYLNQYINPLIKFDEENNTELLKTVMAFINTGCNYRETAKQMYVHHNTIRYRLETVEKVLSLDFSQPETSLNMMLALKLYNLKR